MGNIAKLDLTKSRQIFEGAKKVIPGGLMGIRNPKFYVPDEYPMFIEKGYDGHLIDVDGNDYIDLVCGYGPIILGYNEKEINDAVFEQIDKGFCFTLCQESQKILAEKLTQIIPSAENCVFVKNGSDATSLAVRIARAYTEKRKVLRGGYHGFHDWCVQPTAGILEEMRKYTIRFPFGDLDALEKLLKEGDVAAVITSPLCHNLCDDVKMPEEGYLEGIRKLADQYGAVLIFDEIRTGFRMALGGGQEYFGVTPDISCIGKGLANGYALSACVGKKEFMECVYKKDIFISATYFPNSLEMVAALKCIEILERDNVVEKIWEKGKYLTQKFQEVSKNSGLPIHSAGIPVMPFILFDKSEPKHEAMTTKLFTEMIRRKVLLTPDHHWYLAYRHTYKDIEYIANAIAESLEAVKRNL